MNVRALYVSKLAKCPLTCLADLAGDRKNCHLPALKQRFYAFFCTCEQGRKRKRPVYVDVSCIVRRKQKRPKPSCSTALKGGITQIRPSPMLLGMRLYHKTPKMNHFPPTRNFKKQQPQTTTTTMHIAMDVTVSHTQMQYTYHVQSITSILVRQPGRNRTGREIFVG
jgi:hypothetical protein